MPEPVDGAVAVIGPGSIGATVAACLHEAGARVLLCGRTPYDQIVVTRDDGPPTTVPGPVLTDPDQVAAPVRLVFLAVKATQVPAAAGWLDRLTGPDTVVCVLQNGVEQVELVSPYAPVARVLPAVVWHPAETVAAGRVRLRGAARLTVPDDPGGRAVAAALAGSSCEVEVSPDFVSVAWRKLCMNAVGGLMVLSHRRAAMFHRPDIAALSRAYVEECAVVGRAEGANLGPEVVDQVMADYAAMPADVGSSILFDHEAGRPLEWDPRNGVVRRRAARHGIRTPISDVVVPLLAAASAPDAAG